MNKLLTGIATIALVGAVVAGATVAFYNDTETSSGNIFTAGSVDLKVDHLRQTYNDVDCATCSASVWSSESTQVTGGTGAYNGDYPTNAQALSYIHPNWLQSISGSSAQWIWVTDPVLQADTTNGAEYTFEDTFNWNGTISGVNLDLALAADNGYKIVFNGTTIVDQLGTEYNYGSLVNTTSAESLMLPLVVNGENTLEITVRNKLGSSNPASNPAGLIFDLTIERPSEECEEDSAFQQVCQLWEEKDLGDEQFFNFGDVKPADHGTNLISLHVETNDAYACLITHDGVDNENHVYDPEIEDGDTSDNGEGYGELQDYLEVFVWQDNNGDGEYQTSETAIGTTTIDQLGTLATYAGTNGYLTASSTAYVGLAWCAGDISVDETTGDIDCDGNGMPNKAQSDSYSVSLTAYAEQVRNNQGFSCANADLSK
jgi:predicted ribosomally synthesized peptide with SipW-like signal peptide